MKVLLTGGFLGSGKTTAIQQACLQYVQQNRPAPMFPGAAWCLIIL